jgi:hypothetical protein
MKALKSFAVACLIAGVAVLGDYYRISDRILNPIKYRKVKVAPGFYQKPFDLEKRYILNDKGLLEVYFGHNDKWHKVTPDLRINERSLEQMLKDHGEELAKNVKDKYQQKKSIIQEYMDKIVELYREIFTPENANTK